MAQASIAAGTYEVQVYANGQWRSVAAFDDRLTAIDQAKDLAENPRFLSVKVIKEQFDDLRQLYVQQTVYRSAPLREETPEQKEKKGEQAYNRIAQRHRERVGQQEALKRARQSKRQQQWVQIKFALSLTLRLLLILALGLGGLYWILTQY
jgi:hypothetical protein